ncbi:molybdate ABC transporter permease subunit [Priestia aryabhattai]|uniref:molybdate ABC transporter permease subunit n=1 Tax=Priestia aryabhattai TaxID=412384 RepID=UPI001C0D4E9D|nr:molybdate ABC transporter permease subunit [Priestia aryabhattai]MBU3568827.1 molybdate ABC transporter permease subunit [Priestia aryabhattai]
MWNDFLEPVLLSLEVSFTSGIIVIVLGTLIGWFMVNKTFKGKVIIETIILLPLVLSPTVIGFLLIVIFGKNSWLGEMIKWIFHRSLLFTWWAAVIASAVVAFPLMYQAAKAGFHEVDKDIEGAALVDGANKFQVFLYISIPLASKMLVAGGIMSLARALGEFGATLMFAGNIPGETQTLPTAIYVAIDAGNMTMAWLWVLTTILISFLILLVIHIKSE